MKAREQLYKILDLSSTSKNAKMKNYEPIEYVWNLETMAMRKFGLHSLQLNDHNWVWCILSVYETGWTRNGSGQLTCFKYPGFFQRWQTRISISYNLFFFFEQVFFVIVLSWVVKYMVSGAQRIISEKTNSIYTWWKPLAPLFMMYFKGHDLESFIFSFLLLLLWDSIHNLFQLSTSGKRN